MKFPPMIYGRFLTGLSILLAPSFVAAQVVVSEVMYDLAEGSDSGREWIEVYAIQAVDLTKLKVVENGSNHAITATAAASIPLGAYAVIADNPTKFRNDHPSYAGFLFDSAFSLNNNGESISLADTAGSVIDVVAYTNASGNGTGDSLQRNVGENQFRPGIPTPGLGIPAGGLAQSPLREKIPSKKARGVESVQSEMSGEVVGKSDSPVSPVSPSVLVAGAARAQSDSPLIWWLAPLLIAGTAGAGISLSRHFKKDEWQIEEAVEENEEKS